MPIRPPTRALLAGLAGALLLGASGEEPRVAVLPLVVHTTADHAVLREGLSDMLAARLGRAVAVTRISDPARATTDAEAARAVAREVGADWALFGSFTRFGEGASLDVACVSASGNDARDPRSIFIQAGSLAAVIPALDGLAEKVVAYVTGRAPPAAGRASRALERALAEIETLRKRVEELERDGGASAPAGP